MKLRSAAAQGLALGVAAAALWWVGRNIALTLGDHGISLGFGFLRQPANFEIGDAPVAYDPTDSFARAIVVGLANTARVSVLGWVFAIALGFILGILRLSTNPSVRGATRAIVELVRNVPLLLLLLFLAGLLWYVVARTRLGMLIRAGASNRTMVGALGINIRLLYTVVFGFGAALAGLAGVMAGPIYSVQPGMGELILIQVFVVIVIGGIGSVRGALVGALIVGMVDTLGRAFLRPLLGTMISPTAGDSAGPALASMLIFVLMAVVLTFRPQGLFPPRG